MLHPLKKKFFVAFGLIILVISLWLIFTPRPPLLEGMRFSVAVFDNSGSLMRLGLATDEYYRIYTPLGEISPQLVQATLLYEDRHFYHHIGVNPFALLRAAAATYLGGGRRMGASTITMQLARLRLGLDTTGIWGKLVQIERALAYERYYSKDEILEAYLNIAPYGGNIEGCGAAALIYYHKKVVELNLMEVLSLATVPQNPAHRNPLAVKRLHEQAGSVEQVSRLELARERLYHIWVGSHPEDKNAGFLARANLAVYSPQELPFRSAHVSTEALLNFPEATVVTTSIDYRLQTQLELMLGRMVNRNRSLGINNATALLLHWPSMEVKALVGSADFFDPKIEGQVDGTRARRSPGSTLKPFIYALALEQGLIHPSTVLYDTPRSFRGYDPENADQRFKGPISARVALQSSRNIPAIYLAERLKKPNLYTFLQDAGVKFDYSAEHYGLSLVLGGAEVNARELAALYAALANKGKLRDMVLFKTIRQPHFTSSGSLSIEEFQPAEQFLAHRRQEDKRGDINEVVPVLNQDAPSTLKTGLDPAPKQDGRQILSPEAAVLTLLMLRGESSLDKAGANSLLGRMPMYWKTGTSNGYRDAWTAGVFGPYVLVVWVGNFDNSANPLFVGATVAAPLFRDIANSIYKMESMRDMALQGMEKLNITKVKACSGTGDVNNQLCPDKKDTWYIPGVSPIADSGVYREILIDVKSGLRACVENPPETKREVWEFWPTDLLRVFRAAGIMKPAPPPFLPECGIEAQSYGPGPEILSPKSGVVYHRSLSHPEGTVITLHASADADVTEIFWFVGGVYIGRSSPDEHLIWQPPGGVSIIYALDNFGRSSEKLKVKVVMTE